MHTGLLNNKLHFLAQEGHHQSLYKAKQNMLLITYFTFLTINIIIIIIIIIITTTTTTIVIITCNNIFYVCSIFM